MNGSISVGILAAKNIIAQNKILTDEQTRETYIYQDGGYVSGSICDSILDREIKKSLGDNYNLHHKRNALGYIKDGSLEPMHFSEGYISVKNGYIQLGHRIIIAHHPGIVLRNKLPIIFDPNVDYSSWNDVVLRWVDEKKYVDSLQEFIGYCFTPGQYAKKLLYTYGNHHSGKTTFYEIVKCFLGPENCSDLSLEQLCMPFLTHNLHGKLANIRADVDYSFQPKTLSLIKTLTGNDTFSVDIKYNPVVKRMKNEAKIMLSGNGVPNIPTEGVDDALYDRWLPIPFPNEFQKDDHFIKQFLTKNYLSAILKWALDGLDRLKANKWEFTYNPSIREIEQWFQEGMIPSDVEIFLSECCVPGSDNYVKKSDLHEDYKIWCGNNEYLARPANDFGRKVANNRKWLVTRFQPVIEGEQEECWRGIKLRPRCEYV